MFCFTRHNLIVKKLKGHNKKHLKIIKEEYHMLSFFVVFLNYLIEIKGECLLKEMKTEVFTHLKVEKGGLKRVQQSLWLG